MKHDSHTLKDKATFVAGSLFTLLVISISALLFYLYLNNLSTNIQTNIPEKTIQPIATTEPNNLGFKNTEIEVLNATKVKGLAKVYADKLILIGYTKVKTGNFTESADTNILYAPADFKSELEKIDFKNYKFIKSETIKVIIGNQN